MDEDMPEDELTALDVLWLIGARVQWMRASGETDVRGIRDMCQGIERDLEAGKSRDQIVAYWDEEDEDDAQDS